MPALKPSLRLGKKKHRYLFTVEEAWLVCGGALLQPARPGVPPTLSLSWKSGKKTAYGGAVRAGAAARGAHHHRSAAMEPELGSGWRRLWWWRR